MNMGKLKVLAAKVSLKTMLNDTCFDICTIRNCLVLMGKDEHPKHGAVGDAMAVLKTLHCVNYRDMEPELREHIPALINIVLADEPTFIMADNLRIG